MGLKGFWVDVKYFGLDVKNFFYRQYMKSSYLMKLYHRFPCLGKLKLWIPAYLSMAVWYLMGFAFVICLCYLYTVWELVLITMIVFYLVFNTKR
jgi:hypothetical protein